MAPATVFKEKHFVNALDDNRPDNCGIFRGGNFRNKPVFQLVPVIGNRSVQEVELRGGTLFSRARKERWIYTLETTQALINYTIDLKQFSVLFNRTELIDVPALSFCASSKTQKIYKASLLPTTVQIRREALKKNGKVKTVSFASIAREKGGKNARNIVTARRGWKSRNVKTSPRRFSDDVSVRIPSSWT